MFPVGSVNGSMACLNVSIINDMAFEKMEDLLLHIVSTEDDVMVFNNYTTLRIEDNDCE